MDALAKKNPNKFLGAVCMAFGLLGIIISILSAAAMVYILFHALHPTYVSMIVLLALTINSSMVFGFGITLMRHGKVE